MLDAEHRERTGIDDASSPLRDCAHPVLGMEGSPDLADQEDVEGSLQRVRDLVGDGHATAGEAEHNRILGAQVFEALAEPATSVSAVGEQRRMGEEGADRAHVPQPRRSGRHHHRGKSPECTP